MLRRSRCVLIFLKKMLLYKSVLLIVGVLNLRLDKKSYKGYSAHRVYCCTKVKSTELASGSKIADENVGDMENFLVTHDSTHRGFC